MDQSDPEDSFLTVAEVAEMLKLNQQTVRNWIDQGSLPALQSRPAGADSSRSDFDRVLADGYTPAERRRRTADPSADDFWGGEPVGRAEPGPSGDAATHEHDELDRERA